MRKLIPIIIVGLSALALTGCAASADKVAASYVSPLEYENYDCDQLAGEAARVHDTAVADGVQLNTAASHDQGITAVGAILFWPAFFFLGGNQQKEAEYAKLRGEYNAIQQVAVQKKCENVYVPTTPIVPVPPKPKKAAPSALMQ